MRRIPELDGLRGIAALTVVLFHLYITAIPFGWAAVDLFFTLSGFLITGIILEQMDRPGFLLTFYARRSLRIWPIYYLTIAVVGAVTVVTWREWLPYALYVQNTSFYITPTSERAGKVFATGWSTMNHTWSLAVEEQFYLIWPGLMLLAGRARVPALATAMLVTSVAARWAGYPHTLLISRCDGLALGAILAWVLHGPRGATDAARRAAVRPWLRVAAVGIAALTVRLAWSWHSGRVRLPLGYRLEDPVTEVLAVCLLAFVAIALIVVESGHARLAWLRSKPLRDLGAVSYGIYLYHAPVLHAVDAILPRSTPGYRAVEGLITLAATFAIAALSWRFVERPILELKDRFDYPTTAVACPDAVRSLPAAT